MPNTLTSNELMNFFLDDLKNLCDRFCLPVSGVKSVLCSRLRGRVQLKEENFSKEELQNLCDVHELARSGSKSELVGRLRNVVSMEPAGSQAVQDVYEDEDDEDDEDDKPILSNTLTINELMNLYVDDLKDLCETFDEPVSGPKYVLCSRLRGQVQLLEENFSKEQLQTLCDAHELPRSGTKSELIERLQYVVQLESCHQPVAYHYVPPSINQAPILMRPIQDEAIVATFDSSRITEDVAEDIVCGNDEELRFLIRERKHPNGPGYIYIMTDSQFPPSSGFRIKVGSSIDVGRRYTELRTGNLDLDELAKFYVSDRRLEIERKCHAALASFQYLRYPFRSVDAKANSQPSEWFEMRSFENLNHVKSIIQKEIDTFIPIKYDF